MKIKKNIAVSENGFVFDPTTGDSYSLNPIGAEIMTLMKEGKDMPEIQKFIINKYEVDQANFEKAYFDFITVVKQYHLTED